MLAVVKERDVRGQFGDGEWLGDLPILDLDHLGRYTLGDERLQSEILGLFRAQVGASLQQLLEAQRQADEAAWRMAIHTLKGSARAVGAVRLGEAAERAERAGGGEARRGGLEGVIAVADVTVSRLG